MQILKHEIDNLVSKYDVIFNGGTDIEVAIAESNFVASFNEIKKNYNLNLNSEEEMIAILENHFAENSFNDGVEDWNSAIHYNNEEAKQEAEKLVAHYTKLSQ